MPSSLFSRSHTVSSSPLDNPASKSASITGQLWRRFISKKLLIFATLIVPILGYTNLTTLSTFLHFDQGQKIENRAGYVENSLAVGLVQPTPTQIAAIPAIVNSLPPKNVFKLSSLRRQQATATPEPTLTPTASATNTATPTATSSPTATNSPTTTNTPTLTLTPSPTSTTLPTATSTPLPMVTPQPETKRVVIISIDGLRPDALSLADTPNIDSLIAKGAYSPNAQTIKISVTLPSHASMVSGMMPEKHGILWGLPYIGWPGMNGPTLFNVVHNAGLQTGMVVGKEKLGYLVLENSVDKLFCDDAHDTQVKEQAVKFIQADLPNILFIHFPDVDRVGHEHGWMSQNQLYAITFVDGLIGEIVAALEKEGYLNSTLLILTADHGGHGFGHGDDSPLDRTIPWLAVGPEVRSGLTLATNINTYDTAATVLYALDLPIPEIWDGQPVLEIFQ